MPTFSNTFGNSFGSRYFVNTTSPFLSYTSRSGNTLIEENGLNARILPAVFKGNGSAYYPYYTSGLWAGDDWVTYLNFEFTSLPSAQNVQFIAQGANMLFRIATDNNWYFAMSDGTNTRNITITNANLPFQVRKYSFKIVHSKTGATTIYESGVQKGTVSGTFTNLSVVGSAKYSYFGYGTVTLINKVNLISCTIYSDIAETIKLVQYSFTGDATTYDVSGNNRHIAGQSIVAANKSYSLNGSLYCFDSGYTIWEKSGSADIVAPYGVTTSPIATGYSIARVFKGGSSNMNFADALVGFNETMSVDPKLEIFDRSNTTIQTNTSRSSSYYSATDLATKSRYHASELFPYEKILTWFNTDYQDRIFPSILKTTDEFSITSMSVFENKITGGNLVSMKADNHIDGIYYVGSSNNFRKVQRAVSYAYDGNTLNIGTGSYSELIDLSTKRLNLIGSGNRETIINYIINGQAASPTVNIGTASTFTNMIFDHEENTVSVQPILNINNANPVFINCGIGQNHAVAMKSQKPFVIAGTSNVQMLLCTIKALSGYYSDVKDSAQLTFTGDYIKGSILQIANTAKLNLTLSEKYYTGGMPTSTSIVLRNSAEAIIDLQGGTKYYNTTTGNDRADGNYASFIYVYNDARLDLTGTDIHDGIKIDETAVNAYVKVHDVTRDRGFAIVTTSPGAASTVLAEIYDSTLIHDCDDAISGRHLYELGDSGHTIKFINCHLEWTGFSGIWDTLGNPMYGFGTLVMRNCTLIDSIDDGSASYQITFGCVGQVDIEDCTITQTNYIGAVNQIIGIQKGAGLPYKVRLKNVDFIDGGNPGYIIWNNQMPSYDVNDMVYIENCTINGTLINPSTLVRLYADNSGGGLSTLQTLLGNWVE